MHLSLLFCHILRVLGTNTLNHGRRGVWRTHLRVTDGLVTVTRTGVLIPHCLTATPMELTPIASQDVFQPRSLSYSPSFEDHPPNTLLPSK